MKKISLALGLAAALLLNNGFAQTVNDKGGTTTKNPSSTTSTDNDRQDKVKSEMFGDAAQMAKEWTQKLDEVLNLSPDQEKRIMEINLRYANRMEEMKTKYSSSDNRDMEMAQKEKDQMTENRLKDYAGVLNKEQMTKFREHRQSLKDSDTDANYTNKDKAKDKYENATPEDRERMKEEAKEKRDQKQSEE